MNERVQEVLDNSSVYQALTSGYISVEDLLASLPFQPVTDITIVAYRFACTYTDPNFHYSDGKHILSSLDDPVYRAVYFLSGGRPETPLTETTAEGIMPLLVGTLLMPALVKLQTDKVFSAKMNVICGVRPVFAPLEALVPLILLSRSNVFVKILKESTLSHYFEFLISCDYLDLIANIPSMESGNKLRMLHSRCQYLIENATSYWNNVAKKLYEKAIQEMIDEHQIKNPPIPLIKAFSQIFPHIFPAQIEKFSNLATKVYFLPSSLRLYVLGFPFSYFEPTLETISQALLCLSELGLEKYAEKLEKFQENQAKSISSPFCSESLIGNGESVIGDSVFSYSPFDRVEFRNGNHTYYFIRNEFMTMLKTKKNHWTGEKLPKALRLDITLRFDLGDELKLPPSEPIRHLLEKVEMEDLQIPSREDACTCSQDMLQQMVNETLPYFSLDD